MRICRTLTLLVLLAPAACRKGAVVANAPADAGAPATQPADDAAAVAAAVAPSRCRGTGAGVALVDGGEPEDLEIGDAVAFGDGWAVGIVRKAGPSRMAAVALVGADATSARVVDLAPTLGDAPPPRLAPRGADLLAASYVVSKRTDVRELALYAVAKTGAPRALATVPQQRDDSLAYDLAPGLVVWDEASTGTAPRGIIRAVEILAGDQVGPAHDVTPPDSDAEMPRLAPAAAARGYAVFWLARRPEQGTDAAARAAENVGEARTFAWLESSGTPPRRLTSTSGHVSGYDVESLAGGDALVVARDDGESVDGSGGALLRIRVHAGGADPPLALPTDGLGRGGPTFVDAQTPWLSWIGPHEAARLLPLDGDGAPVGRPSAEPELDDARPLALLPSGAPRMLIAAPGDVAAQLRVLACAP